MKSNLLLLVILITSLFCYKAEKKSAFVKRISAPCLLILSALMLSLLSIVPGKSPVYDFFLQEAAPVAIALFILGLDLSDFRKIDKKLIVLFIIGTFGVLLGGLISHFMALKYVGSDAPKAVSQLVASYIGGGENAVAIKEIISIPNELFVTVFIADNLATSIWVMICAYFGSKAANGVEDALIEQTNDNITLESFITNIALGLFVVIIADFFAERIDIFHKYIYLTAISLFMAQIPAVKKTTQNSFTIGSLIFLGFFFSIGAISKITTISETSMVYLFMPFVIVAIQES